MKFLCLDCDKQMHFEEREVPGDGTFGATFRCPTCDRRIAMLANPMETQLVDALGVRIGGRTLDDEPMEQVRRTMVGRDDAFEDQPEPASGTVRWSPEALDRLERVPSFVRGMVKRIYREYALERDIRLMTPDTMDRARTDLGLEDM
jgi:hypothetical protein